MEQDVRLGSLDESVLLVQAENGDWLRGEDIVASGESTVAATNGSIYVLALADGRWRGVYRAMEQDVRLGSLDESVLLVQAENGDWLRGEDIVASGESTVAATNGSTYVLALADGRWQGIYRAVRQSVPLGSLGESVVLDRLEGGDWLLGEDVVASGETSVVAANGSVFTLRRSGDDRWRAQYRVVTVNVPLGETGRVAKLERSEHATWWIGAEEVISGTTQVTAGELLRERPVFYRLVMVDERWIAVPAALEIFNAATGEGLAAAFERVDQGGYDLDGASGVLDQDGSGEIQVKLEDGTEIDYRVWRDEDKLRGFRHDTMAVAVHDGNAPRLAEDDPATPYNEADTNLEVGGLKALVGELFELGGATGASASFVEPVRAALANILESMELFARAVPQTEAAAESIRRLKVGQWKAANDILRPLSLRAGALGALAFASGADDRSAIARLEAAVAALADSESFADAVASGLFGQAAADGAYDSARAFAATRQSWSQRFGTTERTRFGSWARAKRGLALGAAQLDSGAFAYTPAPNDIVPATQLRGSALYLGRTSAVTPDAEHFSGDIKLRAHFGQKTILGQVSDLRGEEGQPWTDNARGVRAIVLPAARLGDGGDFAAPGGRTATLRYRSEDGNRSGTNFRGANWHGQFVGEEDRSQPAAAIGTWAIAATESESGLRGGFGAEWEERIRARPSGGGGGSSGTSPPVVPDPCAVDCGQIAAMFKVSHEVNVDGIIPSLDAETRQLTLRAIRGPTPSSSKIALNARDWMVVDLSEAWSTGKYSQSSDISLVEEVKHRLGAYRARIDAAAHHIIIKDNWHPAIAELNRLGVKNISPETGYEYGGGLPRVPLTDPQDVTSVDKAAALAKLDEAIAALQDLSAFQATLTDTALFEFEAGTDSDDLKDAFEATQQNRYQAHYRHTDYTRFGIWSHRVRDSTSDGEFSSATFNRRLGFEGFGYSPLERTPYDIGHGGSDAEAPAFPRSGTAVYNGRTLAGNQNAGAVSPPYRGDIELRVQWGAPDGTERAIGDIDSIRVGATITNLVDGSGQPWHDGWGEVAEIRFHGDSGPGIATADGIAIVYPQIQSFGQGVAPDPILPGGKMNGLWFSKSDNSGIYRLPANALTAGLLADSGTTRQDIAVALGLEDPELGSQTVLINVSYSDGSYDATSVPSGRSIATGTLGGEFLGALREGSGALIGHWSVEPNRWLPNDILNTAEVSITYDPGLDLLLSWSQEYNDPTTAPNRKERLGVNFAILESWNAGQLSNFLSRAGYSSRFATDGAIHGLYGADLTEFLSSSPPDP